MLVAFATLASLLGLETILGAFIAGVILRFVNQEPHDDAPGVSPEARSDRLRGLHSRLFRRQWHSGRPGCAPLQRLDHPARANLSGRAARRARDPALLYRPLVGARRSVIAGLLQATSLTFIVAATQIGLVLGLITRATGAALIVAGLLSVLIFPVLALTLLRRGDPGRASQSVRTEG